MNRIVLDLFCGAGGASMGYYLAGYRVVGVDIAPQPNYPFEFVQADWEESLYYLPGILEREGDLLIHASPPCQGYAWGTRRGRENKFPRLIPDVRERLEDIERPYVIENIQSAFKELRAPILLCGSMFNIGVNRHRLFESNVPISQPVHPSCYGRVVRGEAFTVAGNGGNSRDFRISTHSAAMGIDWMTKKELSEAIPPAYTKWIGENIYGESGNGLVGSGLPIGLGLA